MSQIEKGYLDKGSPLPDEEESFINVLQNAEFGRYLVAGKDIKELSLILNETPVTVGPGDDDHDISQGEVPMCLGCCVRLSPVQKCTHCGWPICGESCQNLEIHAINECILFRERSVTYPPPHTWPIINKSVLTLRCLMLKERNRTDWDQGIGSLEHHTEVRQRKAYCVKGDEMLMENLEYFLGVSFDEDDELRKEIIKISGIINVNAFSTTNFCSNIMIAQCIYRTASLFANTCVPNCTWRIGPPPTFQIWVRAAVGIQKGELISISYSPHDTLCGTLQRQISNEDVAHFTCLCARCKDPTEFGTFISAVKCPNCFNQENNHEILLDEKGPDQGYLLPLNPLLPDSSWICNSKLCDESQTVHKTFAQTYKIQELFESLKNSRVGRLDEITELEEVLKAGGTILHRNHYLLQEIRMHIVKRQIPVLEYLDGKQLESLIQHTKRLLNIANILAPGFSQIRALLQHFLAQELRTQLSQIQSSSIETDTAKNETDTIDKEKLEPKDMEHFIQYLETRALLFFQTHNYQYQLENERIIKNIKNSLEIE